MLQSQMLTADELSQAIGAAVRARKTSSGSIDNEFICLRPGSNNDQKALFSLVDKYVPFLTALLGSLKRPGSDGSPYQHPNQLQIAIKRAGFEGYAPLEKMSDPGLGHIDQSVKRQLEGRACANYSCLLGICLQGKTMSGISMLAEVHTRNWSAPLRALKATSGGRQTSCTNMASKALRL